MPQAAFLHQCDKQNLIPKAFGLVNMKGKEDEIRSYSMGNNYAQAYGQGLSLSNIRKVNISDNRLNEKGSYGIL